MAIHITSPSVIRKKPGDNLLNYVEMHPKLRQVLDKSHFLTPEDVMTLLNKQKAKNLLQKLSAKPMSKSMVKLLGSTPAASESNPIPAFANVQTLSRRDFTNVLVAYTKFRAKTRNPYSSSAVQSAAKKLEQIEHASQAQTGKFRIDLNTYPEARQHYLTIAQEVKRLRGLLKF